MVSFILKYKWPVVLAFAGLGIISLTMLPLLDTEPDLRNYIPGRMDSRAATDSIEKEFGVQDIVMILFIDSSIVDRDNLERISNIDRGISRLDGVARRMSPFTIKTIKSEDGTMVAGSLIGSIPESPGETAELREKIPGNSFVEGIVFSNDLRAASITVFMDDRFPELETLARIDSVLAAWPGKADVITGGLPYVRLFIMKDVRRDAMILVPAALMLMLLILKLSLKDWKSVMMPFSVVVVSTVFSMALIPVEGWKLSLMTLLAPVILIAVANNYGIYLTARYQEISVSDPQTGKRELISELLRTLVMPIMFSALTTIAGILGLLTHSVIAARQVGFLAASGVVIALVMSLLYIPALISMRKPYHATGKTFKNDILQRLSVQLAGFIIRHPGKILVGSIIITLIMGAGAALLRTDTRQEVYFPKGHPVRNASVVINEYFGGSQAVSAMVSGDIKDPDVMRGIDRITRDMENEPGVGGVFSISQVVREMSKALYDPGEEGYDAIPGSREAIAQFFELYNMSGDPDDFSQIMNFENTRAQVMIRLSDTEDRAVRVLTRKLDSYAGSFPAELTTGGYAVIMSDFAMLLIKGQVSSILFALITVGLLLSIIFRSARGGITGSIPFTISIIIMFGFMGLTGIAIDPATALLSSIMIGVGVDFTIQYIWSFNNFVRSGWRPEEAVIRAHETIGRSIMINAFSVMAGFSVLILSGFTSIRFFGYLVFVSIGSCLLGAVIIIPALLLWLKPRFASGEFIRTRLSVK